MATNKISLARLQSSASKLLLLALRSSSRRSDGANIILPICYTSHGNNALVAIIRNIEGRRRREMIRDYYAAGKLEKLFDELLKDCLDDEARDGLSRIHPTFMGGEYLPNYRRQEIEIVRISLESPTSDVISPRARPVGSRIKYHLVDECQTEFGL